MYASMGFSEMPQDYIVRVERSTTPQTWTFNRKSDTEKQMFEVWASFQFVKLSQAEMSDSSREAAVSFQVNEDWFYAFNAKSSAQALLGCLSVVVGSLLLVQ